MKERCRARNELPPGKDNTSNDIPLTLSTHPTNTHSLTLLLGAKEKRFPGVYNNGVSKSIFTVEPVLPRSSSSSSSSALTKANIPKNNARRNRNQHSDVEMYPPKNRSLQSRSDRAINRNAGANSNSSNNTAVHRRCRKLNKGLSDMLLGIAADDAITSATINSVSTTTSNNNLVTASGITTTTSSDDGIYNELASGSPPRVTAVDDNDYDNNNNGGGGSGNHVLTEDAIGGENNDSDGDDINHDNNDNDNGNHYDDNDADNDNDDDNDDDNDYDNDDDDDNHDDDDDDDDDDNYDDDDNDDDNDDDGSNR